MGGFAGIGCLFGRMAGASSPDMKMGISSHLFMGRLRKEITDGTFLCRDIAAVNGTEPKEIAAFRHSEKFREWALPSLRQAGFWANGMTRNRMEFDL